ncbi:hypothetical protein QWM81_05335 [Streptomyces ficellus]|uniref:Low molecular weight antigen MTB12-like C-terminal domain-containing protein n=1 Tax=Streptomyces ficellus TaxID=1977088 RepID=A0ABT7Z1X8_9ACTN|nr:hypothetical protein [Streptomyces ficellus]MDN3293470.1 hypothetical protein [Streptomyces ficellus]
MLRSSHRTAALAAAAALVLVPVAAGCGDDNGGEPQRSPTPTATATSPGTQTPTQNQPADPAAARQQIQKNWTAFFSPRTPAAEKVKLLENGQRMQPVLQAFARDPNAAQTSVNVKDVAFTSATQANVTYDLLVGGRPALPNSKGTAVEQDGTWKVSTKTLCALVKLSPNATAVPGC